MTDRQSNREIYRQGDKEGRGVRQEYERERERERDIDELEADFFLGGVWNLRV